MIYIDADHLSDGLYNVKDGKIYKYKAKGGTVRTYELRNIIRCGECKYYEAKEDWCYWRDEAITADDFCSYGNRSEKTNNSNERSK